MLFTLVLYRYVSEGGILLETTLDLDSVALCPKEDIPLAMVTGKLPHCLGGDLQYVVTSRMWADVLAPMLMHRLLRST